MPPMSAGFHFTFVLGTNMYTAVKMVVIMKKGASESPSSLICAKKGMYWPTLALAVSTARCESPRKLTTTMGPTMSSDTYSVTRRAKLRACSTRHRKLKLSSTFLIVPNKVHNSSARPTAPTRPVLTSSAIAMTRAVSMCALAPMGRKNSSMSGASSRCAPNRVRMANANASSGTIDSSVAYTSPMACRLICPRERSRRMA